MQPVEGVRGGGEGGREQNRKAAAVLVSSRERLNDEGREGGLRESNEGGRGRRSRWLFGGWFRRARGPTERNDFKGWVNTL